MWVWHACLSSPAAPCDPRTWGEAAEMAAAFLAACFAIVAGWLGLFAAMEWLESLPGGRR